MPGFVEVAAKGIEGRLAELADEISKLEGARAALLDGGRGQSAKKAERSARGRERRARPRRNRASSSSRNRPETPTTPVRGGRGRREQRPSQALELIRKQPGITVGELAGAMKIQPSYLYRVLPRLARDGMVKRQGKGWQAV